MESEGSLPCSEEAATESCPEPFKSSPHGHTPKPSFLKHVSFYKKVKLSLNCFLTEHHTMKAYWGNGSMAPLILGLGTRWRWSASRSGRFTPKEGALGTHWIGGWVAPGPVWTRWWRKKFLPGLESPIIQSVAQRYSSELSLLQFHFVSSVIIVISVIWKWKIKEVVLKK
jgi:hypothetical protein